MSDTEEREVALIAKVLELTAEKSEIEARLAIMTEAAQVAVDTLMEVMQKPPRRATP